MTTHSADRHGAPPRTEEDHVPTVKLVLIGVVSLVIFFIASVWASRIMTRGEERQLPHGPAPAPAFAGKDEVGIVDLDEYGAGRSRGDAKRAEKLRRLQSYGWVDQQKGLVHIPIERAMELTAQGVRP
jgi:hypothetical protein